MQKQIDTIIVGAGLTGLTLAYYLKKAGKKVLIIEKEDRVGGVMRTTHKNGFTFETGPVSGSMGSAEMAELFEDLEDKCELEIADEAAKQRWIWKGNKWNAIPSGIISGIKTPLFSWKDKFRLLGEPFRRKGTNPDESLADMVRRRLGDSILNYAVNPFVSGVYAGDPEVLITKYALPKLYLLEQNYGSFIGGAMKKAKEKTERDKKATKDVFTAKGGIENLVKALESEVGKENIILNTSASFAYDGDNYSTTIDGVTYTSTQVVTTAGAKSLSTLLPFIDKKLMAPITQLKYATVVQAVMGYNTWQGKPLNAFGGLVPSLEKRNTLGILFPSSIFTNRAPEDGAMMTIFLGGIKRPDIIKMSDEDITALALKEVKETLHCTARPDLLEIARYPVAIPQYDITSKERFAAIKQIQALYPGLHLAGNIRDGIGMSDRVKQARHLADQLS